MSRKHFVTTIQLSTRIAELQSEGWTMRALSALMRGRPGGRLFIHSRMDPAKLVRCLAALAAPGEPSRQKRGRRYNGGEAFLQRERDSAPLIDANALDSYQVQWLLDRRARRLAELRAANEAKRVSNLQRAAVAG